MAKKKSIFSALEGGHLDATLFGSQITNNVKAGENEDEQTRVLGRQRLGRRLKTLAKGRKSDKRKTRPDSGV